MREMENRTPQNIEKYKSNYSEGKLWKKVRNFAKKAGVKVIYMALLLYYVLKSPNVTKEDKAKIYGALGYFILPIDLIPDAIPLTGFADDISVLAWALHAVWKNITPEVKQQAQKKLLEFFPDVNTDDLDKLW